MRRWELVGGRGALDFPGGGVDAVVALGGSVNAVSPGLTDDSVLNGLPNEVVDAARNWHTSGWTPMGRMGTPADIGNVVSLLCSEQANFNGAFPFGKAPKGSTWGVQRGSARTHRTSWGCATCMVLPRQESRSGFPA